MGLAPGWVSSFFLTPEAARDLESIWQYIARDSVPHADLVEEAIYSTCRSAAAMEGMGHRRPDVDKTPVLFLAVEGYKRYSIAYLSGTSPLRIVRVVHGARNVPKLFR
jgi:plasmid stabilization system protein ParE